MAKLNANDVLSTYVSENLNKVEGWAGSGESVLLLGHMAAMQEDCDAYGAFEIGVHHGRYLIALHALCAPGTRSLGLDIFGDQAKNVDGSGSGDEAIARSNLDQFAREPELIELRQADSLAVTDSDVAGIASGYGAFRLASVDGGHTPIHVVRDTTIAATLLAPGGFISIDDFFHTNFPGVTEGFYRLMETQSIPFVPLVVTRKKLILCHLSYKDLYQKRLNADRQAGAFEGIPCKNVMISGYETLSFYT